MSREIKFRAWHQGFKKTINSSGANPAMIYSQKASDALRWHEEGQPVTVMQFTGLKDKNRVDIYEDDIVLLHNKSKYTKEEYWFPVYKIEYYKTGFKCQYVGGGLPVDNIEFNFIHYPNNLDVIGNIYENPELLKP